MQINHNYMLDPIVRFLLYHQLPTSIRIQDKRLARFIDGRAYNRKPSLKSIKKAQSLLRGALFNQRVQIFKNGEQEPVFYRVMRVEDPDFPRRSYLFEKIKFKDNGESLNGRS